jgi:hypothetical protein
MTRSLPYLELVKFRYHITYLTVVFAAAIFNGGLDLALARSLIALYLFFNVFFYAAIIATYLLLVAGARFSPVIRSDLHRAWTR